MRRAHLIVTALVLAVVAPQASAMPGDPPITLLTPAPDAVLPGGAAGLPVTYACPVYRQVDLGDGFAFYGKWSDYRVQIATGPELGTDGRLRQDQVIAIETGHQPNTLPADQCAGELATGRSDGPENTPGTYYWQASRLCGGCAGGYEVSEVRRLVVRADARLSVRPAGAAFAGYPVAVPLRLAGVPDGASVTLQRRVGKRWKAVGAGSAAKERGEVIAVLPAGVQSLRASARLGTQAVVSPAVTLRVRPASSPRVTSAADDGAWGGTTPSVRFRVAGGGRTITGFRAGVTMLCPQVGLPFGQGQLTTQAGFAIVRSARIAPDGRFIATYARNGTAALVRGTLRGGRLTGGVAELSVGTCSGSGTFTARRS
jgi:hypothetical protein